MENGRFWPVGLAERSPTVQPIDRKMMESDRKKAIRKLRKMFKSGDVCPVRVQY